MGGELLGDMEAVAEVVLRLHHVRQALVRDVEQVDEGLHEASFQQICAYILSSVEFAFFGLAAQHAGGQFGFRHRLRTFHDGFVTFPRSAEQVARCLRRLLEWLDLLLLGWPELRLLKLPFDHIIQTRY